MDERMRAKAEVILNRYLEENHRRKTPERAAVLDAVFAMTHYFTLEQLNDHLLNDHFRVSRATLYSTMKLFEEVRLVTKHHIQGETKYEACLANEGHCLQVCTICGKVTEISAPAVIAALEVTKYRRFHKDSFTLYLYGICSTCQAKRTRMKKTLKNNHKAKKS